MTLSNRRGFLKKGAVAGLCSASVSGTSTIVSAQNTQKEYTIKYRDLGSTGYKVSEIGFGAMNTRDAELIHAAIDGGINYVDTAHGYMNGVNEQIVGKVMQTKRDKVFLTTKLKTHDATKIEDMMKTSLDRLKVDYVDLVLLHVVNSSGQTLESDMMKAFEDIRRKGMTRFIGVSTHSNQAEVLDASVESGVWEAVLVGYNYFSPPEVQQAIARARKAGLAIIGMKNLLNPATYPWKELDDIRTDKIINVTPQQALIKWVLEDTNVDTTIPGMTSFEQLYDDLAIMDIDQSFRTGSLLQKYGSKVKDKYCCGVSGCTGCLHKCPKGVEVSDITRCMRYYYGYGNIDLAREQYRELSYSPLDTCADCDECSVSCINGLNLTETIQRARSLFA